ncbi:MAG: putative toxin-antitoxin system toxin component, PIN family [Spirochaetia bacterium]|jgi:putative PIN family toxin of toxin-antitoxin system|nr:putative toxin-antitoxin system toxin component, PIN family [Spirochaetia bacterium]
MKIVLDTNVIISALINPDGIPAQILNLVINGKILFYYDNRILKEYSEVLRRKKFGFEEEWVNTFIDFIKNEGEFVVAEPLKIIFEDEDDKKFFEVAKSGKVFYLVTGNKKHFPKDKIIVTPKEFMVLFNK